MAADHTPPLTSRQRAQRRGRRSETLAGWWLRAKGYRILARDFRTPVGEIDLIVRRGSLLVFIEVKHRTRISASLEAVTPRQRRRIERAATLWYAQQKPPVTLDWRFDVIVMTPWRFPRHICDAWRPEVSQDI